MQYKHIPALLKEALEFLNVSQGKVFIDCTLGGGGHTENIKIQNPKSKIYGFDQDSAAIEAAKEKLSKYQDIIYIQDNFKNIKQHVKEKVDGILLDLGISSYQIDTPERGFSLRQNGPLDMRMNQEQKLTAATIINQASSDELEKIFKEYGEERFAKRIARAIVRERSQKEITTTLALKTIVEKAIPTWKKRESVTRIFQALRIAVNQELDSLRAALKEAIDLLNPGGRIVVLSYHSLEDRLVKQTFKKAAQEEKLTILTKKPIQAQENELASNPRAKSAKLRAGEKR